MGMRMSGREGRTRWVKEGAIVCRRPVRVKRL